jgi:hypothetical protein
VCIVQFLFDVVFYSQRALWFSQNFVDAPPPPLLPPPHEPPRVPPPLLLPVLFRELFDDDEDVFSTYTYGTNSV